MFLFLATLCNAALLALSNECGIAPDVYKDFEFLDVANGPSGRILNGQKVAEHALPFVASLGFAFVPTGEVSCTASIIAPQYVLTAAHCYFQSQLPREFYINQARVHYGSKYYRNSHIARIVDVIATPRSTLEKYDDILILKLARPIRFDYKTVSPVCLSEGANADRFSNLLAAGYGNHSYTEEIFGRPEEYLVDVLPVKKGNYCNAGKHEFCAGGVEKGTMIGDSGGPLMGVYDGRFYQVGIVARGRTDQMGLIDETKYIHDVVKVDHGTYTRVADYCGFIEEATNGAAPCRPLSDN